ncbi:hypothetical protein ACXR2W_00710 [Leucobacter sp. HY1908]
MKALDFSGSFPEALRSHLVDKVNASRLPKKHSKVLLGLTIGMGVVAVSGGVAVASDVLSQPGSSHNIPHSKAVAGMFEGSHDLLLGAPPAGADVVAITFTCLSKGEFSFPSGTGDPSRPSDTSQLEGMVCLQDSVGSVIDGFVPIASLDNGVLSVIATDASKWSISASYATKQISPWGLNESGRTFGSQNERGSPDLVPVLATNGLQGYAYVEDIDGGPFPTTFEEAARLSTKSEAGYVIPVYESDGTTVIGEMKVGPANATDSLIE